MTFIICNVNRQQVTLFGRLLIELFPGCTIHQSCDPMRVIQRLSSQNVDAVFVDSHTLPDVMNMLKHRNLIAKIWLLRRLDEVLPEEKDTDYGVLSFPASKQEILEALKRIA